MLHYREAYYNNLIIYFQESRDDITSKSLAMILDDIGQAEAAAVIRRYID